MATRGRPPGQGKVPGSGRKKGSLDRSARLLISEQVAFDILKTYKRLGPDWLFKIAQDRPDLFINQCLSKILPPAFKDEPDIQLNQQINIGDLSDRDAAVRVAFALSKAMYGDPAITTEPATIEAEPQEYINSPRWRPPADAPDMPEPVDDAPGMVEEPDKQRWIEELPLTPQERRDKALVRNTREATIENYAGSSGEQGGGTARSPTHTDPRSAQRDRMLARRCNELL